VDESELALYPLPPAKRRSIKSNGVAKDEANVIALSSE
jgi:hypothetical protein